MHEATHASQRAHSIRPTNDDTSLEFLFRIARNASVIPNSPGTSSIDAVNAQRNHKNVCFRDRHATLAP